MSIGHASSAHAGPEDRLLKLQKLSLEEEEMSRSMQSQEVDKDDPCSMCPCCRGRLLQIPL